jgi:hypothetical protein
VKKTIFILAILLLALSAQANPVIARAIARVWFDNTDDFWVTFGHEAENISITNPTFSTMAGSYMFPAGYSLPGSFPCSVNFTDLVPGFTIQKSSDYFSMSLEYHNEVVFWGPEADMSNDLHELYPGQSATQARIANQYGDHYEVWAKDQIVPGNDTYYPVQRCTLNVHVTETLGNPAAGVPVHLSLSQGRPIGIFETDTAGDWQIIYIPARLLVGIYDPLTNNPVLNEIIFPEPGETIQLNATVSGVAADDPLQPTGLRQLRIYPSVLTSTSGSTIYLKYGQDQLLLSAAELLLFDLRGRLLATSAMPVAGETEWSLPNLPSGIYFIALEDGSRQLGKARFTVIK